jgi:hypothetical protein
MFGLPRQGAHSYRLFDFAIVDVLATLVVAWLVSRWWYNGNYTARIFAVLVLASIPIHWVACVDTRLTRLVGLSPRGFDPRGFDPKRSGHMV